jgi:hypothetical protein
MVSAWPASAQPAASPADEQRARDDLQGLLLPGVYVGMGGSEEGTGQAYFSLRPVATRYQNLCRHDTLMVGYSGPIGDGREAQARRVPFSVDTTRHYFILRGVPEHDELDWATFRATEGECTTLTGDEEGWFEAPSAETAAAGYRALTEAQADIRGSKRDIPGCRTRGKLSYPCEQFLAYDFSKYGGSVGRCESVFPKECYDFYYGTRVTIHLSYRGKGEPVAVVDRILIDPLPSLD